MSCQIMCKEKHVYQYLDAQCFCWLKFDSAQQSPWRKQAGEAKEIETDLREQQRFLSKYIFHLSKKSHTYIFLGYLELFILVSVPKCK